MVSRRNCFSIVMMMMVLLFLCQLPQVIKEQWSDYGVNLYLTDEAPSGGQRWMMSEMPDLFALDQLEGDFIAFIGEEDSAVEEVVRQWCLYTKRNMFVCESLEDGQIAAQQGPEAVLIDARAVDVEEGIQTLEAIIRDGSLVVFCRLPEPEIIAENYRLQQLLGIQEVRALEIETEGVRLFGDFLLGGNIFYVEEEESTEKRQDLNLTMPWYVTGSGTKTFMVGSLEKLLEGQDARNELYPALIWRNYNAGKVFAIGADFMEDAMGIGILDAIMYDSSDYALYPVVNAQNMMVANFPGFAGENDAGLAAIYSRDTESAMRDLFWPAILSIVERHDYHLTCLMTPQFNYADEVFPSDRLFTYFLRELREAHTEAGLSLELWGDTAMDDKLASDDAFYAAQQEQYVYSAAYVSDEDFSALCERMADYGFLEALRTIAWDHQGTAAVVAYLNDEITMQSTTSNARTHTYTNDLYLRCMETALGYSNIMLNMNQVIWPENEQDEWQLFTSAVASNLDSYWQPFRAFTQTSLSESDERIRLMLNLDYQHEREENTISLDVSGAEEGWFILRLHGERISAMKGGEYTRIEPGAYLIHARKKHVTISVEKNEGVLRYSVD